MFDPFLLSKRLFFNAFGMYHGPKRVTTGSKWAKNTCLSFPNGPISLLEKHVFDPLLTQLRSQNGFFSRHFGIYHVPKRVTTGSKSAKNTCFSTPNSPISLLEKRPLASLIGVLVAHLLCSRVYLKICLGKMAEGMEFHDYLEAVQDL